MIKKTIIIIASLLLLSGGSVKAQAFIMDDDEAFSLNRDGEGSSAVGGLFPNTPTQDVTTDQYAPLGGGTLALGLLGGAYLLGKRRRKDNE